MPLRKRYGDRAFLSGSRTGGPDCFESFLQGDARSYLASHLVIPFPSAVLGAQGRNHRTARLLGTSKVGGC
jgi:hypothetical protein